MTTIRKKMLIKVWHKYGYEHPTSLWFDRLIEDETIPMAQIENAFAICMKTPIEEGNE